MYVIKLKKSYLLLAAAVILFYFCYRTAVMEDRHPAFSIRNYPAGVAESEDDSSTSKKSENHTHEGWHIHINLDQLTLYLYKDGDYINSYPVSGGAPNTPSPLGSWKIISKDTWGNGFGGAWLGFNVPWGQYGIHGTNEPWFIGRSNSSKGCIRMSNKDVRELFRLVPYGSTVTIVHENRTFRNMMNGDIGTDVVEVQNALKKLGYYPWYIDGCFGNLLENSVRKFQKDNGLWNSGIVDKKVYDLILRKADEYEEASGKR